MKVLSVKVTDYKSIEDSGVVQIEPITCIVGKNESGKTSLLEALTKVNPLTKMHTAFALEDYPRNKLNAYKKVHEEQPADAVKAVFEFSADEKKVLEEKFGRGILKSNTVTVTKGYDNKLSILIETSVAAHARFITGREVDLGEFKNSLKTNSFSELRASLEAIADPNASVKRVLGEVLALEKKTLFELVWAHVKAEFLPKFFILMSIRRFRAA